MGAHDKSASSPSAAVGTSGPRSTWTLSSQGSSITLSPRSSKSEM